MYSTVQMYRPRFIGVQIPYFMYVQDRTDVQTYLFTVSMGIQYRCTDLIYMYRSYTVCMYSSVQMNRPKCTVQMYRTGYSHHMTPAPLPTRIPRMMPALLASSNWLEYLFTSFSSPPKAVTVLMMMTMMMMMIMITMMIPDRAQHLLSDRSGLSVNQLLLGREDRVEPDEDC